MVVQFQQSVPMGLRSVVLPVVVGNFSWMMQTKDETRKAQVAVVKPIPPLSSLVFVVVVAAAVAAAASVALATAASAIAAESAPAALAALAAPAASAASVGPAVSAPSAVVAAAVASAVVAVTAAAVVAGEIGAVPFSQGCQCFCPSMPPSVERFLGLVPASAVHVPAVIFSTPPRAAIVSTAPCIPFS